MNKIIFDSFFFFRIGARECNVRSSCFFLLHLNWKLLERFKQSGIQADLLGMNSINITWSTAIPETNEYPFSVTNILTKRLIFALRKVQVNKSGFRESCYWLYPTSQNNLKLLVRQCLTGDCTLLNSSATAIHKTSRYSICWQELSQMWENQFNVWIEKPALERMYKHSGALKFGICSTLSLSLFYGKPNFWKGKTQFQ